MVGVVFFSGMETMPPEGLWTTVLGTWRTSGSVRPREEHVQSRSMRQQCSTNTTIFSLADLDNHSPAQPFGLLDIHPIILTVPPYPPSSLPPSPASIPRPPATLTLCAASRQPHQRTTVSKHECYERLNRVTTPSRSQSVRYILMPVARIADTWPARRTAPSRID